MSLTTPLTNDILFKIVFGTQKNKDLLIPLLNALLGLQGPQRIQSVELLNPFNDKTFLEDKGLVLDIKVRDCSGRHFNIEIQVAQQPAFIERTIYYLAELLVSQLKQGLNYRKLQPNIGIALLDFTLFKDEPAFHHRYFLYDEAKKRRLSDIFELHYIELPKFHLLGPEQLNTPFERWVHLIRYSEHYQGDDITLPSQIEAEEGLPMAIQAMNQALASDEVRELILARRKYQFDQINQLDGARDEGIEIGREAGIEIGRGEGIEIGRGEGIEIGREAGIEIGRGEGIEIGRGEGIEIGREAGDEQARKKVAQRMLDQGYHLATIKQLTDIDLDPSEAKEA